MHRGVQVAVALGQRIASWSHPGTGDRTLLRFEARSPRSQLGAALLFLGLGALATVALTGRAVDRCGLWVAAHLLPALAGTGLVLFAAAGGPVLLVVGMLLVGAASGAADVAIDTVAGRAEHLADQPLLTRSPGLFSIGVVLASLTTGALVGAVLSLSATFAVVAAVRLLLATTPC